MWRLFNKIFGWHYAMLETSMWGTRIIKRARLDAQKRMYVDYGEGVVFLLEDGVTDFGNFKWMSLTW